VTNSVPNDLQSFWLPFTPNDSFKRAPRMLVRAQGMHYWDDRGREILDCISGLWCVNAGHSPKRVVEAIREQAGTLDFAPTFQFGHPKVFELANRLAQSAPKELDRVFFVNSGSEAAETAAKIARAFFKALGQADRIRLIGRERAYHGVNFGGVSLGGIENNRRVFGPLLPGTEDKLPLPYDAETQAFTRGESQGGEVYADALEEICMRSDPKTIAAVFVEPMTGSGGVFASPAKYLKRLREICDRHGILLVFDEVITAFGRLGYMFGAERYGVVPDMICFAKGVTNGAVPLGGVLIRRDIYDAFAEEGDHSIRLFHGYTYTGHPLAAAAGLATLDVYRDDDLIARGARLEKPLEEAMHGLKGLPAIVDIRNVGLAAAVELAPIPGQPGKRGYDVMLRLFEDHAMVVRLSGDTIVFAPALIASEAHIARMADGLRAVLKTLA